MYLFLKKSSQQSKTYLTVSDFEVGTVGGQQRCGFKLTHPRSCHNRRFSSRSVVNGGQVDGTTYEN